ncbi:MAG: TonB-dependent receptor [Acidobacteria bacterium]|nr:TonB-dependent receptor [Acidobacteriota bacterium]
MGSHWTSRYLAFCGFVCASAPCLGQSSLGRLYVRVFDQTDAVLPGVTVTLRGAGIGGVSGATSILGDFCFIRLPQGSYELTCDLDGFESHNQQHIRVSAGETVSLRVLMRLAVIAETVTVIAPLADEAGSNPSPPHIFTKADLALQPIVRDPGGVASLVSGIIIDRADLGAFIAGRQMSVGGFGDLTGRSTTWNIEGLTITDMREIGTSPIQYDFDTIDRIEITSGGVDPSVATGGITLNIVSRQGDDSWNGSARLMASGRSWQDNNIERLATPDNPGGETSLAGFLWSSTFKRPVLSRWYELGLESGGPIRKGRAWFWGAAGLQGIDGSAISGDPDETRVANLGLKLNAATGGTTRVSYTYLSSRRNGLGPGYRSSRPIGASLRTRNPSGLHKFEAVSEPFSGLMLTLRGGYTAESESRLPVEGLDEPSYRDASGEWSGSYRSSDISRPQWEVECDAMRQSSFFGNPHSMRFGFSYRQTEADTTTRWPAGGVISDLFRGLARITRPAHSSVGTGYAGLWAGDTFTSRRCTISAGLRFDHQFGRVLAASTPGSSTYPELLPAVSVREQETPFVWNDLSPRVGISFDVTGRGRTFVRASYARYADQLSGALIAGLTPIGSVGEIDFPWRDANGNGLADPGEIDVSTAPTEFYNIDSLDPGSARSPRTADRSLTAPRRTEIVGGMEHEPWFGFVIGINAIWKKLENDTWVVGTDYKNPQRLYAIDDYTLAGYVTGSLPDGSSYSVPYYELKPERAEMPGAGVDSVLTNRRGYWEEYAGVELFASKTLTRWWSAHGSLSWQRSRRFYQGTAGISDPTNIFPGEDVITLSDIGGRAELFVGTPHWHLVAGGLCQLPAGVDVSANVSAREGYPLVYFVRKVAVDPGSPRKDVRVEHAYERALPAVWQLDIGLSKSVTLRGAVNAAFRVEVFNVLNRNTPLQVDGRLDVRETNEVKDLMQPRTARIGVRVSF